MYCPFEEIQLKKQKAKVLHYFCCSLQWKSQSQRECCLFIPGRFWSDVRDCFWNEAEEGMEVSVMKVEKVGRHLPFSLFQEQHDN